MHRPDTNRRHRGELLTVFLVQGDPKKIPCVILRVSLIRRIQGDLNLLICVIGIQNPVTVGVPRIEETVTSSDTASPKGQCDPPGFVGKGKTGAEFAGFTIQPAVTIQVFTEGAYFHDDFDILGNGSRPAPGQIQSPNRRKIPARSVLASEGDLNPHPISRFLPFGLQNRHLSSPAVGGGGGQVGPQGISFFVGVHPVFRKLQCIVLQHRAPQEVVEIIVSGVEDSPVRRGVDIVGGGGINVVQGQGKGVTLFFHPRQPEGACGIGGVKGERPGQLGGQVV